MHCMAERCKISFPPFFFSCGQLVHIQLDDISQVTRVVFFFLFEKGPCKQVLFSYYTPSTSSMGWSFLGGTGLSMLFVLMLIFVSILKFKIV